METIFGWRESIERALDGGGGHGRIEGMLRPGKASGWMILSG